jgi:hypothetical protein
VEAPGLHVLVKIGEIGVLRHRFVEGLAVQPLSDHLDQCGFSDTDVARNRDKFFHGILEDVGVALQANYSIAKNWTQKSLSGGERLLIDCRMILGGNAGAGRADVSAGTAVLAQVGVDDVLAVAGCDGSLGAFSFAGAAHDAVSGDLVGHDGSSFLEGGGCLQCNRIAPSGMGVN